MSTHRTCTHIKVTGVRCGSPALRGEQFCYFHQNAHRGVRRPPQSRLHPIALIEDEESIQFALMEVINALMRNTIDYQRANLIIRALHIAVKNASRVKYGILGKDAVKQVPDYAEPTAEHQLAAQACELPAVSEIPYKPVAPGDPHYWEYQYEGRRSLAREAAAARTAPGATAASAVPAQAKPSAVVPPLVSTAESSTKPAATSTPATQIPPHDFKSESAVKSPQPSPSQKSGSSNSSPPQRKPPATANQAPQQRKNTAHRASAG